MRAPRPVLVGLAAVAVVVADLVAASSGGAVPAAARTVNTAALPSTTAAATTVPPAATPAPPKPVTMWVDVTAANIWDKLRHVRRIDAPSLGAHPNLRRWVAGQTLAQREALGIRLMTQALRGEPVVVIGTHGSWAHVRVVNQRGSVYRDGIIGWMPRAQLSAKRVVVRPLPLLAPRGSSIVHAARTYLGTTYIFGGMTTVGIDCSGLTYLAAQRVGIRLPRDAADQSRIGRAVARRSLRPGDLVFFGPGGRSTIHHVGIYVGHGRILHAPHTGSTVRISALSAFGDYWGARRIVPAG
jgi:cell wall-associated NlpC family hydrolase